MEAEIDIRAVFGVLRRQIRLVLGVFIVISGVAAAIVFTLTPLYTATTLVMVDPSDKNLLAGDRPTGAVSANDPRIEGEVMLARSDSVLLEVIAREDLIGGGRGNIVKRHGRYCETPCVEVRDNGGIGE
jgi:succinoglycan biosynthesis transport protein ExoP